MSDLVQRLRLNATIPLVMEAADRIEALEAALREIAMLFDSEGDEPLDDAIRIASRALAPEPAKMNHPLTACISEIGFLQGRIREKNARIEALEAAREAMELARNIIHGPLHNATRERDYAKAAEYQSYIDTLNAALAPEQNK